MDRKRPTGRKKFVTDNSTGVFKRDQVQNGGPVNSSSRPDAGSGRGDQGGGGQGGGTPTRSGRKSPLLAIIIALVAIFGGGGGLLGSGVLIIAGGIAQYFKLQTRSEPLIATDLKYVSEAANISSRYTLTIRISISIVIQSVSSMLAISMADFDETCSGSCTAMEADCWSFMLAPPESHRVVLYH